MELAEPTPKEPEGFPAFPASGIGQSASCRLQGIVSYGVGEANSQGTRRVPGIGYQRYLPRERQRVGEARRGVGNPSGC